MASTSASIPLHVEPLGKTIKVGVQTQPMQDVSSSSSPSSVAVSAGMLRELIEARFGPDAVLTTADGNAIPDTEIIWSRDRDGAVALRPGLHIASSTRASRSASAVEEQERAAQQGSSRAVTPTAAAAEPAPRQPPSVPPDETSAADGVAAAAARRQEQRAQLVGSPLQRETAQRHRRQLAVAQTLLETDRVRWTQQLEVLRHMRDTALQVLGLQRQQLLQRQSPAEFPPLEQLARRLGEEQAALDAGAPAVDARRGDIADAEQLLDTLQQGILSALQEGGVVPAAAGDVVASPAVPAQYASAPAFLRETVFKLALKRVQLAAVQESIQQQQQALEALRQQRRAIVEQAEDTQGHVRVVVRQRPYLDHVDGVQPKRLGPAEVGESVADEHQRLVRIFSPATGAKHFEFVRVFGPPQPQQQEAAGQEESLQARQQEQIFDEEIVPLLRDAIQHGTDATAIFYGPSSSGKSYSVFGDGQAAPGLLELALTEVMHFSGEADLQATELYLDQKTDLLAPASSSSSSAVAAEHTWVRVKSAAAALKLVSRAALRRITARTLTNDVSSRSHLIFSVRFPNNNGNANAVGFEQARVTKLTFVDLAGCERVSRSLSTGDRLREAQHINKSLSAIGDVVHALASHSAQRHIPYRNSKLTMMLQAALGGASRTLFVLCIPPHLPEQHNMAEIVSALTFASRARGVRNKLG